MMFRRLWPATALAVFVGLMGTSAVSAAGCPPNQIFCSQNPPIVNPPPITPVASAIPLVNPGFEDNATAANFSFINQITQHGWERGGAMVLGTFRHRCGTRSLSTGGSWGGNGFAYTQITLPSTANAPVLDVWLDIESRVAANRGVIDTLRVFVDSGTADMSPNTDFVGTNTPPAASATWSNLDATGGRFVAREVPLPTTLGGQPIRGQTIQLWFVSSIGSEISSLGNGFNPTTTDFYVDDVSLWTASPLVAWFPGIC